MTALNTCYQCGKKSIVVKSYEEVISGSVVKITESICSDPDCQKRTEKMLEKEKARRDGSMYSKIQLLKNNGKKNNLVLTKKTK